MRKLILLALLFPLVMTGCTERKNPLLSHDSEDVAQWIYNKKTPEINRCSEVWANLNDAPDFAKSECEAIAKTLAVTLKEGGFGNITAEDAKLPTLWLAYLKLAKASSMNKFDAQKAGEAMKLPESGSLGAKIDAYKRERDKDKN